MMTLRDGGKSLTVPQEMWFLLRSGHTDGQSPEKWRHRGTEHRPWPDPAQSGLPRRWWVLQQ